MTNKKEVICTEGRKFSGNNWFYHERVTKDPAKSEQMVTNHFHNFFEIYYLEKGECNYFIGGHTFRVSAGDIVIIPEGVIHKTTYSEPYSRAVIYFPRSFMSEAAAEILSSADYLYRNHRAKIRFKNTFVEFGEEYNDDDPYTEVSIRNLITAIALYVYRNPNEALGRESNSEFIVEALKHITDNYMYPITLSDMAQRLAVSPEHLSRTFKKETGFGFSEYCTVVRLQKAEEMLHERRDMNVSQISYACGFNDSNYFSDKFKKFYGMSPLKYRKQLSDF